MIRQLLLTILTCLACIGLLKGQISLQPVQPGLQDTVTITYDAKQGNGALQGISPVYVHTGVLTSESNGPSDWKFVKTDWAANSPEVRMEGLGNDLHRIRFHISSYYELPPGTEVLQLAFVFRNADGSVVGRTANGGDIFYPLLQPEAISNVEGHRIEGSRLTLYTENGEYQLQAYQDNIIRAAYRPDTATAPEPTGVVVLPPSSEGQVEEMEDYFHYQTSSMEVWIRKTPLQFTYLHQGDTLLRDLHGAYPAGEQKLWLQLQPTAEAALHGSGSRTLGPDLYGSELRMFNQAQYGYGESAPVLNTSIPFLLSTQGYGLYFDHTYPFTINSGQVPGQLRADAERDDFAYYLIAAPEPATILDDFTALSGKAPLPPRWALGYIQSRFGYQTEAEARQIVEDLQQQGFPLDALVLDLYWFGDPGNMGDLDWDEERFPDPEGMIEDFRESGVKTVLITEPYVTSFSDNFPFLQQNPELVGTDVSGNPYLLPSFWAGPALLLDLMQEETQDWMWPFYQSRIEEGVAGWWCDLGEPELHPWDMYHGDKTAAEVHNYFSLEWARFLQQRYREHYPGQRLFNLIRSGYAGMQRFSTFPWSGDVQRSFAGLRAQIPIMLNMGYSGVGYMHSDIGGFTGGSQNGELYTRWQQLGAFSPIMRAHGVNIPPEPIFYPAPYRSVVRSFIELRYRLLPYNYTLAWENSRRGWPLARAMNFYRPQEKRLQDIKDQYFWGEQLLVAPVLEEGATSREVVLPEGRWTHYFTDEVYEGGGSVTVEAPIGSMPLLVRGGSLIPHTELVYSTDQYDAAQLDIWYYPDPQQPQSTYTLYNDDGQSPQALDAGQFEQIAFEALHHPDSTLIRVEQSGEFDGLPAERELSFRIKNIALSPQSVRVNGTALPILANQQDYENTLRAAYYDGADEELLIRLDWANEELAIVIRSLLTTDAPPTSAPQALSLQAYPTIVQQKTTVNYHLPRAGRYRMELIDLQGSVQSTLLDGRLPGGAHQLQWALPGGLPKGIYYLRLSSSRGIVTAPVIVQ